MNAGLAASADIAARRSVLPPIQSRPSTGAT
jgi:hypothetical protein